MMGTLRKHWRTLVETKDAPVAIAGGLAVGIFWGFTPLFGLKTLLALGTAWLLRWNKTAAVIGVTVHDIATPLLPFLMGVELLIGSRILNRGASTHEALHEVLHHPRQLFEWTTFFTVGQPLLVGAVVLGVPVSLLVFLVFYNFLKALAARKVTV